MLFTEASLHSRSPTEAARGQYLLHSVEGEHKEKGVHIYVYVVIGTEYNLWDKNTIISLAPCRSLMNFVSTYVMSTYDLYTMNTLPDSTVIFLIC